MTLLYYIQEIFQARHKKSHVVLMPRNSDVSKVTQTIKENKIAST